MGFDLSYATYQFCDNLRFTLPLEVHFVYISTGLDNIYTLQIAETLKESLWMPTKGKELN